MNDYINSSEARILVVDDDRGARESLKLLLGIDGHTVTEAVDGAEALGRFAQERFDLVITDYLMPNMLGDELARNIRNLAPEQPIVMVTAYFENLCGGDGSADAILAKPFGVDELRMAIAKPMARGRIASRVAPGEGCQWQNLSQGAVSERASVTTKVLSEILEHRTTYNSLTPES
jgi:CheY-like chemotaxis protein